MERRSQTRGRAGYSADAGPRWTRRGLLTALGAAALGSAACRRLGLGRHALHGGSRFDSFPIWRLDGFVTPTAAFFVRDHFGIPGDALHGEGWTVRVEGDVERPFELSLAEIGAAALVERPVTLECAGNAGRNGIGPWTGGGRAYGGASTAVFGGHALAPLLERAGPKPGVVEIVFEGADAGAERGSDERHVFARSVPLAKALAPESMLATRMNGDTLPVRHGGPLRALFPGRYATDSVKWLRRIRAISAPFDGYYQSRRYVRKAPGDPNVHQLGDLRVQSEIARPRPGAKLPVGLAVDVVGVAWGGHGGLAKVEVSVDGGETFAPATFLDPDRPFCWRRWRHTWTPERPGPRLLLARATDGTGASQPFASGEELGRSYSVSGLDRIQYADNAVPIVPVVVA